MEKQPPFRLPTAPETPRKRRALDMDHERRGSPQEKRDIIRALIATLLLVGGVSLLEKCPGCSGKEGEQGSYSETVENGGR